MNVVVELELLGEETSLLPAHVHVFVRTEDEQLLIGMSEILQSSLTLTDQTIETTEMIRVHVGDVDETDPSENVIGLIAVELTNLPGGPFGTFEQSDIGVTRRTKRSTGCRMRAIT